MLEMFLGAFILLIGVFVGAALSERKNDNNA